MNVGRYLRGEDLHVGTSRITKPKELKMNERIKLLAEQAGWGKGETQDDCMACSTFDPEKFAELIIAECIAVHEDDYGIDIIGDVLKKHFGVEE